MNYHEEMRNSEKQNIRRQNRIEAVENRRRRLRVAIAVATVAVLTCFMIVMAVIGSTDSKKEDKGNTSKKTAVSHEQKKTVVTIGSGGDILIHSPFIEASTYRTANGGYNFADCFKYIKSNYSSYDYMVINLETTLAASGFAGYPAFKTPDILVDNLHNAGVDMFLMANNHINDNGTEGFIRSMKVLDKKGYEYTGARMKIESPKYLIKDIKGIKVGFINYTYETSRQGNVKTLNGTPMSKTVSDRLNTFNYDYLKDFCNEMKQQIKSMKNDGAEFIIFYPHFGEEYYTSPMDYQKTIAQAMCNLGVDAIVGGHPHVIEPVEVLTSKDGKRKTFCLYSMGNQVSNQRREYMDLKTGETEDGLIMKLELTKEPNGKVYLSDIGCTPTWTYKSADTRYYILPSNTPGKTQKITGISGTANQLLESYKRTYRIVGKGMKAAKKEFASGKQ